MANQVYFNGDFWQCVAETNPGESPATAAAKWRQIVIPKAFRRVLAKLTYADLLEKDGQTDKAKMHRDTGEAMLDDLVRIEANRESNAAAAAMGGVHSPQGTQSVAAAVILEDAERMMRWDVTDLETQEKQDARAALSLALQQMWEAWWWEALMLCELLPLKPAWAGLQAKAGDAFYFAATGKYYQAVQPAAELPPATLANGAYVLNAQFWAESKDCYAGADVDNTQAYAFGSVARNPGDGLFYQRSGSIQVTGAGTVAAEGIYVSSATQQTDKPVFFLGDQQTPSVQVFQGNYIRAAGSWLMFVQNNTQTTLAVYVPLDAADASATPDQVQGWQVEGGQPGALPGPAFSTLFVAPFDAGSWGVLTPFDHVLALANPVRSVTRQNPQISRNPEPYDFSQAPDGIRVPCWKCGEAYVLYRRMTPVITGDDFDATATYEATNSQDVVYP